jgi:hypothetical protein
VSAKLPLIEPLSVEVLASTGLASSALKNDNPDETASLALSSKSLGNEKMFTFRPGQEAGIGIDMDTMTVSVVSASGQADSFGVKVGWQIIRLNDQEFSQELLFELSQGSEPYAMTFTFEEFQRARPVDVFEAGNEPLVDDGEGDEPLIDDVERESNSTPKASSKEARQIVEQTPNSPKTTDFSQDGRGESEPVQHMQSYIEQGTQETQGTQSVKLKGVKSYRTKKTKEYGTEAITRSYRRNKNAASSDFVFDLGSVGSMEQEQTEVPLAVSMEEAGREAVVADPTPDIGTEALTTTRRKQRLGAATENAANATRRLAHATTAPLSSMKKSKDNVGSRSKSRDNIGSTSKRRKPKPRAGTTDHM